MRAVRKLICCLLLLSCKTIPTTQAEAPPELQLPRDVRPLHCALQLQLDPDAPRFSGSEDLELQLDQPRTQLWLHSRDLQVTAVTVNGAPAVFEQVNEAGLARVKAALPAGKATLHLEWSGAWNTQLVGLYLGHEGGLNYAFTMFEAIDARRAFPGWDEPSFKMPYDVTLLVKASDVAIGNTFPVSEEALPGKKRIRFGTTPPLPAYLLAWAVGPFDVEEAEPLPPSSLRAKPLRIRAIVPRGHGKETRTALADSRALTAWLEEYFGLGFPFEKLDHVGVPDFAWGAEENAGEIHYRESRLIANASTSREDLLRIAGIISHEEAHQWFGDLVTMDWWTDTWLNEGFASWMGQRAHEAVDPASHAWDDLLRGGHGAMSNDSLGTARAVRQPLLRILDVENQFDGITYQKGAFVLSMLEHWLGREKFRAGVHAYLSARPYGNATTDDLLAALDPALAQPAHTFLDQAGLPLVKARLDCSPPGPRLLLEQSRYLPVGSAASRDVRWQIPLCARFEGGEACTLLKEATGELKLPRCPAWIMPNADGAGYYRFVLDGPQQPAQLNVRERLAVADSLKAAVNSGAVPFVQALRELSALAADAEPSLQGEAMGLFGQARDPLVRPEARPRVEEAARKLYAPLAAKLGWDAPADEPAPRRRLRGAVLTFLSFTAHDPGVRAEAARRGREWLKDPAAVTPDLTHVALAVAVQDSGARLFDELVQRLSVEESAQVRGRILWALGHAREPALAARARELAFDARLRKNERTETIDEQLAQLETRDAALQFVQERMDQLLPLIPEIAQPGLLASVRYLCDAERLAQGRAFMEPRASRVPAGERALLQAVEQAQLCIALRAAQGKSAEEAFPQ